MPEHSFDAEALLAVAGRGCARARFSTGDVVYNQGAVARAVFFLRTGKVKIEVAFCSGKNAVLAILEPPSFFGEGCLIGDRYRSSSAVATVESDVLQVDKAAMLRLLHAEPTFAEFFLSCLLLRMQRVEEDLADQLVNSTEQRLARALLLLAHFDKEGVPQPIAPRVSHETLAEMIGAARPRTSQFMHKFRKLGYISYDGGLLRVDRSLLAVLQATQTTPPRSAPELPKRTEHAA
jgi:CRP/FNR family cyclic AMP-dependent transcriptional regulator